MHDNTVVTADGVKTRRLDAAVAEIEGFFTARRQEGACSSGVVLEFTGDDVGECPGGVVPRRHR